MASQREIKLSSRAIALAVAADLLSGGTDFKMVHQSDGTWMLTIEAKYYDLVCEMRRKAMA